MIKKGGFKTVKIAYRELNENDLKQIANNRHNFIKCDGYYYGFYNTKQALIITTEERAKQIKSRAPKRRAELLSEINENNKSFLLFKCYNLASIKALCRAKKINAPTKIKRNLKIDNITIN